MKYCLLLALATLPLLSGCTTVEPQPYPVVVERHHYHTRTRPVYVSRPTPAPARRPSKASPSVGGSDSAEGFRAVEQPGSYSQ